MDDKDQSYSEEWVSIETIQFPFYWKNIHDQGY